MGDSQRGVNPDWLIPNWPAPAHVQAVCTTRAGGQSLPPYDFLNLGDHVGDDPAYVTANRLILQNAIPAKPVFLSQVHGLEVVQLTPTTPHGTVADACLTEQAHLACTIMVADCLPVLFTDTQGTQVAAAHAGWRSLAGIGGQGILEHVFKSFCPQKSTGRAMPATEIIAWLGPCIGPETFEVGADVRTAFVQNDREAQAMFSPCGSNKWMANLQGLARLRLTALGVTQVFGNDGSLEWCTVSQPSRFFSHRRDGVSGRMAACIWMA